jgi:hypothetical protein
VLADIAGGSQLEALGVDVGGHESPWHQVHPRPNEETDMKTLKASIILLGLITISGASVNVAVAGPKQTASNCHTDDGYGRKRACSAGGVGFKRAQKAAASECTVDDGYGRKCSCAAGGVGIKR